MRRNSGSDHELPLLPERSRSEGHSGSNACKALAAAASVFGAGCALWPLVKVHDRHAAVSRLVVPSGPAPVDRQWYKYRFCPVCGAALHTETRDNLSYPVCTNPRCGLTMWEARTPRPTTAIFILQDDKLLMTVRAREPMKGALDIPGGFILPGETPMENARREMAEELGIKLQAIEHVGHEVDTYGSDGPPTLNIGLSAAIAPGATLRPADDVTGIVWVDPHGLDHTKVFAARGQLRLLSTLLKRRDAAGEAARRSELVDETLI